MKNEIAASHVGKMEEIMGMGMQRPACRELSFATPHELKSAHMCLLLKLIHNPPFYIHHYTIFFWTVPNGRDSQEAF